MISIVRIRVAMGLVTAAAVAASSARADPRIQLEAMVAILVPRDAFPASPELAEALRLAAAFGASGDRLSIVEYGADAAVRLRSLSLGRSDAGERVSLAVGRPAESAEGYRIAPALTAGMTALGPRLEGALDAVWVLAPASGEGVDSGLEVALKAFTSRGTKIHVLAPPAVELADGWVQAARETGGSLRIVGPQASLHQAFVGLLSRTLGHDRLVLRGGGVWIDEHVESALVVLDRAPDEEPALFGADERPHRFDLPEGVTWHRFDGFDLVEILRPATGLWRLDQPEGLDRGVVLVRRSPLRLVFDADPKPATTEAPVRLRFRFEENGRPMISYARLKDMEVQAQIRAGSAEPEALELTRVPGGWFEAFATPTVEGTYGLRVVAESPEVVREHRFAFEAERQCFDVRANWMAENVVADVQLRPSCRDLADIRVRARFDGFDEEAEPQRGSWQAFTSGGGGTYSAALERLGPGTLVVEARAIDGGQVRRFSLPDSPSPVDDGGSFAASVGYMVVANLPLLLLPLLWVHRRQLHNIEVEAGA
jgi:hypothetical protein